MFFFYLNGAIFYFTSNLQLYVTIHPCPRKKKTFANNFLKKLEQ